MKLYLPGILFFISIGISNSQELYMPVDLKEAYKNNTRSYNGMPGELYWQNSSNYDIDVEFDPQTSMVKGTETIIYFNRSPHRLDHLVIRLYQDHFKKGNVRNRVIAQTDVHDGVKIFSLKSTTDTISLINRSATNIYVFLKEDLFPEDSTVLKINWEFKLPEKENQRIGKYDGGWFIGLWYPQIAVYDDISGWDNYNFEWEQEFYNDFNSFDVRIKLPRNYLVQGSGTLLNPEETFHENILSRYLLAQKADSLIHIVTPGNLISNKLTKRSKSITWHFKADHLPDFAFCVFNNYLWDGKNISISSENNKKDIFISTIYNPKSADFKNDILDLTAKSLRYFSYEMPEILYPYDQMTVFNGTIGGMEYPMIVNNASSIKHSFTVLLTSHEIAHTYFPFLTGINEHKYSWMDEGWAEFLPLDFQQKTEPDFDYLADMVSSYEMYAGKEDELIPMNPTVFYNSNATNGYRILSYYRAGVAYYYLCDMLGEELFKKALQQFISRWTGKHPIPYDFFYTFNDITQQNLDWFWKPWFFNAGYPDLELTSVEQNNNNIHIIVTKKGAIPVPIIIRIIYEDDHVDEMQYSAKIWKDNNIFEQDFKIEGNIKAVSITHRHIPDIDKTNNTYHFE